jgi:hypothetical protein
MIKSHNDSAGGQRVSLFPTMISGLCIQQAQCEPLLRPLQLEILKILKCFNVASNRVRYDVEAKIR